MVPPRRGRGGSGGSAPRARGDGPPPTSDGRGRGGCSPRTRGWSLATHGITPEGNVLPAHAGMVPAAPRRARGRGSAPRARGDGPAPSNALTNPPACSPRTRGWTLGHVELLASRRVLPAHARMVPISRHVAGKRRRPAVGVVTAL